MEAFRLTTFVGTTNPSTGRLGLTTETRDYGTGGRYELTDSGVLHVWNGEGKHTILSPAGWLRLVPYNTFELKRD